MTTKKAAAKKPAKKNKAVKAKSKPKAKAKKVVAKAKPKAAANTKTSQPAPAKKAESFKPIDKINRQSVPLKKESKKTVLDKVLPAGANRVRYSDNELEEFKKIIHKKLDEARRELDNLTQQMTNPNDHGTDDTAGTFKLLEDGSETMMKEETGKLATRQKKFIEQLENALVRIENKTYGICRVTGRLIPKERLRAVPHTTQSIEAKLNQYRD